MFLAMSFKNGDSPVVIHISIGNNTSTLIDFSAVSASITTFNPEKAWMIHNHPSGNLIPSRQDVEAYLTIKKAYPSRFQDGIIIDTTSGQYCLFNDNHVNVKMHLRNDSYDEALLCKPRVYSFDTLLFTTGIDITEFDSVVGSDDIASFISTQRLGTCKKYFYFLLNRNNVILAYIHTPVNPNIVLLTKSIVKNAVAVNATGVIFASNFALTNNFISQFYSALNIESMGDIGVTDVISFDMAKQEYYSCAMKCICKINPSGKTKKLMKKNTLF